MQVIGIAYSAKITAGVWCYAQRNSAFSEQQNYANEKKFDFRFMKSD
jgi:hypothetical protein